MLNQSSSENIYQDEISKPYKIFKTNQSKSPFSKSQMSNYTPVLK